MPPPQGTPSLVWLTAPCRPATALGLSQSRCLCTPRTSPPSMKVRISTGLSLSSLLLQSCCSTSIVTILIFDIFVVTIKQMIPMIYGSTSLTHQLSVSCRGHLCPSPVPLTNHSPVRFISSDFFCHSLSGSVGNSRNSTQMNSYTDSGYQDASSGYLSNQNVGKGELRMQHSFPGASTGTLMRNARAEGQTSAQVLPAYAHTTYCCSNPGSRAPDIQLHDGL